MLLPEVVAKVGGRGASLVRCCIRWRALKASARVVAVPWAEARIDEAGLTAEHDEKAAWHCGTRGDSGRRKGKRRGKTGEECLGSEKEERGEEEEEEDEEKARRV